jgi:hypothetical protein
MNRRGSACTAAVAVVLLVAAADQPAKPVSQADKPADFKLVIELFGVRKEAIAKADLVVHEGVGYQFLAELPEEVIIIEPRPNPVILLDVERHIQTGLDSARLDAHLAQLHKRVSETIERREKAGTRAARVAADISRDLIDPHFTESYDSATRRMRLSNASVDVAASAEPEPDRARLNVIFNCLGAIAKIGSYRDPSDLPPFTRLDALRALAAHPELRPSEISFIYRLAGPPRKLRWTYQLVPSLTDREIKALGLIEKMRRAAALVPYERYEKTK